MALAKPRLRFSATHFPNLPLCNSRSKLQLENFTHRLRNDEYPEGIPLRAFALPISFHLNIANLRLETWHDVKAASNLLHRLDIRASSQGRSHVRSHRQNQRSTRRRRPKKQDTYQLRLTRSASSDSAQRIRGRQELEGQKGSSGPSTIPQLV